MTRLLLIVAKDQPDLLEYWKRWFSGLPTVEVVLDRRQGNRRQRPEMAEPGQRQGDRRQRPIDGELRTTGFDIVRSSA